MATRQSDVVAAGNYADVAPSKGVVLAVVGTYVVTAETAIGDVIQMCPVPKGAKILDIKMTADGGTASMTASIGDGDDSERFLAAAAQTAAVAWTADAAFGYEYAAADTVDIETLIAAPTEGDTYTMTVMYLLD